MRTLLEQLARRRPAAHKGDFGHLAVIAGSERFCGAAGLAAMAGLRAGAGLVTLAAPRAVCRATAARFSEVMYLPLPDRDGFLDGAAGGPAAEFCARGDALLLGPGLGLPGARALGLPALLAQAKQPVILDADALNCLAGDGGAFRRCRAPLVITPHPGEMSRLTGLPTGTVQADRQAVAADFSRRFGVVTVLKGHRTVITDPAGHCRFNESGNPGMATAGSGDVLAGVIGGLLAQSLPAFEAACLGACLHGLAGDLAAREKGEISLVAGDILDYLPAAFRFLGKTARPRARR